MKPLGYCKECHYPIYETENLGPDHPNVYECVKCGYPNTKEDMWKEENENDS